jgi:hypothetical protein
MFAQAPNIRLRFGVTLACVVVAVLLYLPADAHGSSASACLGCAHGRHFHSRLPELRMEVVAMARIGPKTRRNGRRDSAPDRIVSGISGL